MSPRVACEREDLRGGATGKFNEEDEAVEGVGLVDLVDSTWFK